ncbi:hypothetical protein [Deinococcus sp. LM3]|uniref:hypothetical protein n=1 Tax=Deinococcus sp. LM3 TaxID=1938608 RepID=UPI0023E3DC07|nr:hypothetical protein [Deinococcus sp. LM3]
MSQRPRALTDAQGRERHLARVRRLLQERHLPRAQVRDRHVRDEHRERHARVTHPELRPV